LIWRWGAAAVWVACSVVARAQTHPCTEQQSQQASEAVDTLNSWDRIHHWYIKYRQCDDGGPAEGVSEAVARNLVDRWETLPRLSELAKDASFRHFVLKHLDETLNADDLKKISANATKRCPASLVALCRELKRQADAP
jgi:hypothetical protein